MIRSAEQADLPAIVAIYNHYVETDHCTFDTKPFSVDQRQAWFNAFAAESTQQCLVAVDNSNLLGFAHSGRLRPKPGYDSSVETTIYLAPDALGRRVGHRLYQDLLSRLERLPQLHRAYGVIAQPNAASNTLHEQLGFEPIGRQTEVGRKFGRYWDVVWYQRAL